MSRPNDDVLEAGTRVRAHGRLAHYPPSWVVVPKGSPTSPEYAAGVRVEVRTQEVPADLEGRDVAVDGIWTGDVVVVDAHSTWAAVPPSEAPSARVELSAARRSRVVMAESTLWESGVLLAREADTDAEGRLRVRQVVSRELHPPEQTALRDAWGVEPRSHLTQWSRSEWDAARHTLGLLDSRASPTLLTFEEKIAPGGEIELRALFTHMDRDTAALLAAVSPPVVTRTLVTKFLGKDSWRGV